jgi:hypothetical protein
MDVFVPYGINIMMFCIDAVIVFSPDDVVVRMLASVAATMLIFCVDPRCRLLLILPAYSRDRVFCIINLAMSYSYMSSTPISLCSCVTGF